MNRRSFLVGAASGVAAFTGALHAQAPAAPAGGQGRQGGQAGRGAAAGGRGRGGGPANVPAAKLDRIEIMTLNHSDILKRPWNEASPQRTLDILDMPQYYVDLYGVHNIEFQANDLAQQPNSQADLDLDYWRALRAKIDAAGSKANQINIEIGTMARMNEQTGKAEALAGDERAAWMARAKKWVDASPILGVTRLMHNQGALTDDSKAGVISMWKELQDYAKPKGIMISGETRGSAAPVGRGAAGAPPPAPPQMSNKERLRYVWGILWEATEKSGGYTNLDFGGDTRFLSQQELHDAIKGLMPRSAGTMHTRTSPTWDLGLAVKYAESIGFKGKYTIEVNGDPALRIIYNTVLTNLA